MANPEHVAVVKAGAEAIAGWRLQHPRETLDLSGADLSDVDLSDANLSRANLFGANLEVGLLLGTDLSDANLSTAKLSGADFFMANLSHAHLSEADLRGADLTVANLRSADFSEADLTNARFEDTAMVNCDLSRSTGLDSAIHEGSSSVGTDTLISSFRGAGNKWTPQLMAFSLGAGVPRDLLNAIPAVVREIKYDSCFISYGEPDRAFAEKLREELLGRGISCWLFFTDHTPGERTWREIGEKRREADKMVVICSVGTLVSEGARKEIEEQIDEDPDKLIPISLEETWKKPGFKVMREGRDLKPFLMERNYADFSDPSKYEASLEHLLTGLEREDRQVPSPLVGEG